MCERGGGILLRLHVVKEGSKPCFSQLSPNMEQCMNQMCHGSLLAAVFRCMYSEIHGTQSGEDKPCSDVGLKCVCI